MIRKGYGVRVNKKFFSSAKYRKSMPQNFPFSGMVIAAYIRAHQTLTFLSTTKYKVIFSLFKKDASFCSLDKPC